MLSSSEGFEEYNEPAYLTSKKTVWASGTGGQRIKLFFLELYGVSCVFCQKILMGDIIRILIATVRFLCYPTEYAKQNLKPLYKSDACNWWLCNPQFDTGEGDLLSKQVEMVSSFGECEVAPMMNTRRNAVRPAMWVTWQSDMQVIEE